MGFRGTPWSTTTYYRRVKRAQKLGCAINELPDGRGRHGKHCTGKHHPRWNTGTIVTPHGYKKVRVGKSHLLAEPTGYVSEHLLIWVANGNPKPPPGFVIHHINEDTTDNQIENLELKTLADHLQGHLKRNKPTSEENHRE